MVLGGVIGAYANVTEDFAFLTPSLSYDANNVFLTLALLQGAFSFAGNTPNEKAVGYALDRSFAGASGDFATDPVDLRFKGEQARTDVDFSPGRGLAINASIAACCRAASTGFGRVRLPSRSE